MVEYWAHVQAFMPVDLWPVMRHRMAEYRPKQGKWWRGVQDEVIKVLLAEIADRGASTARELEHTIEAGPRRKDNSIWFRTCEIRASRDSLRELADWPSAPGVATTTPATSAHRTRVVRRGEATGNEFRWPCGRPCARREHAYDPGVLHESAELGKPHRHRCACYPSVFADGASGGAGSSGPGAGSPGAGVGPDPQCLPRRAAATARARAPAREEPPARPSASPRPPPARPAPASSVASRRSPPPSSAPAPRPRRARPLRHPCPDRRPRTPRRPGRDRADSAPPRGRQAPAGPGRDRPARASARPSPRVSLPRGRGGWRATPAGGHRPRGCRARRPRGA